MVNAVAVTCSYSAEITLFICKQNPLSHLNVKVKNQGYLFWVVHTHFTTSQLEEQLLPAAF